MSVAGSIIGGLFGASKAGAIFGVPAGFTVGTGTTLTGAALGAGAGAAAGKFAGSALKKPVTPPTITEPSPITTTAGYASQAEKQRRQRRKGYGSTILAGGELGVASTYRKQILGG